MGIIKKSLQDLEAEQGKLENELKVMKQKYRFLEQRQKELTRRKRTHRLCNHGGLLECFLPSEQFSDEQMETILKELFRKPEAKELIVRIKNETLPGESL